jgi:signal transduction histidine kinase
MHQTAIAVGHNLKMPIITMEANIALIEQALATGSTGDITGDLSEVKSALSRIKGMLDELLELGRLRRYDLSTLTGPPDWPEASLNDVIAEAQRALAANLVEHQAVVEVQPRLPRVRGKRRLLVELFQNLISNAVKFTPADVRPAVRIGMQQRPEGPLILVQDNGPGIRPEDRERVFELFSRLDESKPGSGAGLAIVRRIILSLRQRIWIEDGPNGRGTSFCFTLPFVDEPS